MNIETFRSDFIAKQAATGMLQSTISEAFGVKQSVIANFVLGKRGLAFGTVIKLWPFVYGVEFPSPSKADKHAAN